MKIHEFCIKSHRCHCERSCLGEAKQSRQNALTEIASSSRGGTSRNDKLIILALGAESAGNFSIFHEKTIYFSDNFGDLLDEKNFKKFQKAVLGFLKRNKIKPDIILTDLHPLYKTTILGTKLAKKYKAKHVQVQHHLAHIFSAIGERYLNDKSLCVMRYALCNYIGIALDGTGYGLDGKIWGGEVFQLSINNYQLTINRIGHLENQTMIGGDLAVKEPARILISVLNKFINKDELFRYIKKFYTKNQFELLYNQLQNNFNCQETSSTARILDAVSLLLGFCKNERNYKHEPIDLLEKNSTTHYTDLKPKIVTSYALRVMRYELCTTYLFEYLIKNIKKDKKRLAATAQLYIAKGLYEIIKKSNNSKFITYLPACLSGRQVGKIHNSYIAGGIANNKIIANYLESKDVYTNKKIPRGDAGISFGQIFYYLFK